MQQAAGMMPQSGMQQQQQQQGVPQQASGMPQQASGMPQQMGMHQQQNQPQPVGLHQPAAVPLQQNAAPQVKQSDPQIPNQGVEIAETNTGETEVIEVKDSPSHQASKPSAGGQKEDTQPLKLYIPPAEGKQESQDSTGPSRFTVQKVQEDQSPKDLETAAAVVGSEVADKMSSSSLNVSKVEEKPEEVKRKDSLPERPQPSADADPELPREEIVDIGASQQQQQSQGLFTDGKFSVQGSDRGTPDSLTSEGSSIPAPVGDLTVLQGNENVYMVPRPDSAQSVKSTTSQASLPGGGMHNPPVLERTNSSPNSNLTATLMPTQDKVKELEELRQSHELERKEMLRRQCEEWQNLCSQYSMTATNPYVTLTPPQSPFHSLMQMGNMLPSFQPSMSTNYIPPDGNHPMAVAAAAAQQGVFGQHSTTMGGMLPYNTSQFPGSLPFSAMSIPPNIGMGYVYSTVPTAQYGLSSGVTQTTTSAAAASSLSSSSSSSVLLLQQQLISLHQMVPW
ncbi:hypothetical protein BSL78_02982 [Apostichopus japonicus]|uniref:Uncharacterized protein n=1 Tax=Stichopus japonicus TaxID=307972 RepID=A0A2G8LIJ7_STIJA|nr:hypothetical protein BSL78_02982 [Apostichopus japonicus]